MDDARFGAELVHVADHAVVEAGSDPDEHVAVVHRHVRFVRPVHPQHADELGVRSRVRAESHQRVRDGIAERARELDELLRRVVENDAAAGVDHGTLRGQDQIERLLHLPRVTPHHGVVGAHRHARRILVRNLEIGPGHVLGDVHDDRAGPSGGRDVERLLEGIGEVTNILHEKVVLHARTRDAHAVDFLERIAADGVGRDLPGDDHHRHRVHVSGRDARDRIGGARSGGDEHNAGFARGAGIAVGHVGRALFVAHENVLHVLLGVDLVVDVENRSAGIAEDVLHALVLEELHEDLRS